MAVPTPLSTNNHTISPISELYPARLEIFFVCINNFQFCPNRPTYLTITQDDRLSTVAEKRDSSDEDKYIGIAAEHVENVVKKIDSDDEIQSRAASGRVVSPNISM